MDIYLKEIVILLFVLSFASIGAAQQSSVTIDDFEDGDLSEYSANSNYEVNGDYVYSGNYSLDADEPGNGDTTMFSSSGLDYYPSAGTVFDYYFKLDSPNNGNSKFVFGASDISNGYAVVHNTGGSSVKLLKYESGSSTTLDTSSFTAGSSWNKFRINWTNSGTIKVDINGDSYLSATDTTYTDGGIGFRTYKTGHRFDNITGISGFDQSTTAGVLENIHPKNSSTSVDVYSPICARPTSSNTVDMSFYWENGTTIGSKTDVGSSETACMEDLGLDTETSYTWYAQVDNEQSVQSSSNYTFSTESTVAEPINSTLAGFENDFSGFNLFNTAGTSGPVRTTDKAFEGSYSMRTNLGGSTGEVGGWKVFNLTGITQFYIHGLYSTSDNYGHPVADVDYLNGTDHYSTTLDGYGASNTWLPINVSVPNAVNQLNVTLDVNTGEGTTQNAFWDGIQTEVVSNLYGFKRLSPGYGETGVSLDSPLCATPVFEGQSSVDLEFYWADGTLVEEVTGASNNTEACTSSQSYFPSTEKKWYVKMQGENATITSQNYTFLSGRPVAFENGNLDLLEEDGDLSEYTLSDGGSASIVNSTVKFGRYAIKTDDKSASVDVASESPDKLTFWVNWDGSAANLRFTLFSGANVIVQEELGNYVTGDSEWKKVTLDFNWSQDQYDVIVEDSTVKSGVTFSTTPVSSYNKFKIYGNNGVAYWDSQTDFPPQLQSMECHNGSSWGSCSNLGWQDSLTKVRANVSQGSSPVESIDVTVEDVYDSDTRVNSFSNTSKSGDVYVFDFQDQVIDDSGGWNVTLNVGSGGESYSYYRDFNVQWGSLSTSLNKPGSNVSVYDGEKFNLSVNVSCTGGECVSEKSGEIGQLYPSINTSEQFSWAVLPDPQDMPDTSPQKFTTITQYVANGYNNGNFDYTMVLGDMVNDGLNETQWQNFNNSITYIDETGMPWGGAVGNHDIDFRTTDETYPSDVNYTYWNEYMSTSRFSSRSYYGGDYDASEGNDYSNHYELHSFNGYKFIIVYMDSYDSDAYSWAVDTFKQYPDRNGILVTHEYKGETSDSMTDSDGYSQHFIDGTAIKEQVVDKVPNLLMTHNGHAWGQSRNQIQTSNSSHADTWELHTDYTAKDPAGFIRYYNFYPAQDKLEARTYNPVENEWDNTSAGKFTIDMNFEGGSSGGLSYCSSTPLCVVNSDSSPSPLQVSQLSAGESVSASWMIRGEKLGDYDVISKFESSNSEVGSAETSEVSVSVEENPEPVVSVTEPDDGYHDGSVNLSVSADKSISSWSYSLDGSANQSFTPNTTISGLSEGSHSLTVYATDSSGNTGSTSRNFDVDLTGPTTSFNADSTGSGEQGQSYVYTSVSAIDSLSGVSSVVERFNDGNRTLFEDGSGDYVFNHTGLSDGSYTVEIWAEDSVGNVEYISRDITLNTSTSSGGDSGGDEPSESYVVEDLPAGRAVGLRSDLTQDLTVNGVSGVNTAVFGENRDSLLATELEIDFTGNISVSGLEFGADRATAKSFVHNHGSVSGLQSTNLLVPRVNGTGQVLVCPGAENLTAVSLGCSNGYNVSSGESVNGVSISSLSVSGYDYYRVDGITGTGAVEVEASSSSGSGGGGTAPSLPEEDDDASSSDYNWSVSLAEEGNKSSLKTHLETGSSTEDKLFLENTGENSVQLSMGCGSTGIYDEDVCTWVNFSQSTVTLEPGSSTEVGFTIELPSNASRSNYLFELQVTDPSYSEGGEQGVKSVDYSVSSSFLYGLVSKVTEVRQVESPTGRGSPIPVPVALIPVLLGLIMFGGLTLGDRRSDVAVPRVLRYGVSVFVAVVVFLLI